MVLEALNTDQPVSASVRSTIDSLHEQAKEVRDRLGKGDPSIEDFNNFLSRLGGLRTRSIRRGIRDLIVETLQLDPDVSDAVSTAKEVSRIYSLRSTLLHTGYADEEAVKAATVQLEDVVPRVLSIRFSQVVGEL
jgi:hypothetical protein